MTSVIFDLDGTLIDSVPDVHALANRVLAEHSFGPLTLPQVRGFIGKGVPHLIERLLEAVGEDPSGPRHAPMVARFTEGYLNAVTLTTCYPGVIAALDALLAMGCPLGICTNKPLVPTRAVLKHLGLTGYFTTVTGGDSLTTRKPDAAPLHATVKAMGEGPALFVGDSETDAATAQNAAVPFLLFTEGYRKAPAKDLPHDALFSDFADLPGLVFQLSAASRH